MKRQPRIILASSLVAAIAGAVVIMATTWIRADTTLEFTIKDSVSGGWVWRATMSLQGRTIIGFYQSDAGLLPYRFTHLTPGRTTLKVAAPGYQNVSVPLVLKRGSNRLEQTITIRGLAIPDLANFYIFESLDGGDIVAELRSVNSADSAVINHPCMDLWIGARVSVQTKNGVPVLEEVAESATRGEELFRGEIAWTWDPAPEALFRYSARIPSANMKQAPSNMRVIDYLILEPNPLKITRRELGDLMTRLYSVDDPEALRAALDAEKQRLKYFLHTSWNVNAGLQ